MSPVKPSSAQIAGKVFGSVAYAAVLVACAFVAFLALTGIFALAGYMAGVAWRTFLWVAG